VDNKSLSSYNLKVFILSYRVLRCGIVRDVPQDIPADILKESIASPIKILVFWNKGDNRISAIKEIYVLREGLF